MSALTSALTGLLIGSVIIYLILRTVSHTPAADVDGRSTARSHAFWTAVIALFASSTAGLADVGTVQRYADYLPAGDAVLSIESVLWWKDLSQFLTPGLAVAGIYIIAQFTWPRPRKPVRTVNLQVRKIGDFVPRYLAAVAIIFAGMVAAAAALIAPLPAVEGHGGPTAGVAVAGPVESQVAGSHYAGLLAITLLVLMVGVYAALLTITRRRPLETISIDNDRILRQISMNRLLRTTVLVLAGLLMLAAGFVRDHHSLLAEADPTVPFLPVDGGVWGTVASATSVLLLLTIIGMLAWAPPQLESARQKRGSENAGAPSNVSTEEARLADAERLINVSRTFGFLLVGILVLVGVGIPVPFVLTSWWPAILVTGYAAVLLGGELLLRKNYAASRRGAAPSKRGALLETWMKAVLAASVLTAFTALAVAGLDASPLDQPGAYLPSLLNVLVVVAVGLAASEVVRHRASVTGVPPGGDLHLRRVSAHRICRMTAAGLFFSAAQLVTLYPATWTLLLNPQLAAYSGPPPVVSIVGSALIAIAIVVVVIPSPPRAVKGARSGSARTAADSGARP